MNRKCTGAAQILAHRENQTSGEWNFLYIWQNVYRENTMESKKNSEYQMYFPSACAKSSKNFDYLLHKCLSYVQNQTYGRPNMITLALRIIVLQAWTIILFCLFQSNKYML